MGNSAGVSLPWCWDRQIDDICMGRGELSQSVRHPLHKFCYIQTANEGKYNDSQQNQMKDDFKNYWVNCNSNSVKG